MSLRPSTMHFEPGDTLPASKHNSLVASSRSYGEAFSAEHSPQGQHDGLLFEAGMAIIRQVAPTVWEEVASDQLQTSDYTTVQTRNTDFILVSPDTVGVIAQDNQGRIVPVVSRTVLPNGSVRFVLAELPGATRYTITVFARRSLSSEQPDAEGFRFHQGGLGDVLPAEAWQYVADSHRGLVARLQSDHRSDVFGVPRHRDLRWSRAAAILEIPDPEIGYRTDPSAPLKIHAAQGFSGAPRIEAGRREIPGFSQHPEGWWLTWRLPESTPQQVHVGCRVKDGGSGFPNTMPQLCVYDEGGGRGSMFLGGYKGITYNPDVPTAWEISERLRNLSHIYMMIK